jgi:hypothetical protein
MKASMGGDGLHARGCGCAACLGGEMQGKSANFTEILADGTVQKGGAPADPSSAPDIGGTGATAPGLNGPPGRAARSGTVKAGRHPEFPSVYGQTFYSESSLPAFPRVQWEVSRTWTLGYSAKPKSTTWSEPDFPALATPANANGYKVANPLPEYPDYEHFVIVGDTAASNIARAEQQHVSDLDEGWNITANAVGDAINRAAGGDGTEARDQATAQRMAADALAAQLGTLGAAIKGQLQGSGEVKMAPYMNNAFTQSQSKRDKSGNHSFGTELYAVDHQKKKAASAVDEVKTLDGTASSAVVNLGTIL